MSNRNKNCKKSRRYGTDLLLKSGIRDIKSKCRLDRSPGMHWQNRKRISDYRAQLDMKNMIRIYYGVSEHQFKRHYKEADRQKGSTGGNLMRILESRLDHVVRQLCFASTIAEARQLINHRIIEVNGHCVDISSYLVKLGDVISIRDKSKKQARILNSLERLGQGADCDWLETDTKKMQGVFKRYPELSDLPAEFKVNLVVELYSK